MTFKGTTTSLPKHSFGPHLLSSFLLLMTFSEISSTHVLEKPSNDTRPTTNNTNDFGITHQGISNATAESRAPKLLPTFVASRKVDPYIGYWNVSTNGNYSTIRAHSPNLNRTEMKNSTRLDAFLNKRSNSHRQKYPNGHYTVFKTETGHQQDKRKSYAVSEDYEQQVYNNAAEYLPPQTQNTANDYLPPPTKEYDDSYNTIPEDMNTGYDIQITPENDPWRIPYVPRDPGYFGPVIPIGEPPVYRDPPPNTITDERECNCPTTTRSYECDNPSGNFFALVSSLGKNLWALISLIAISSVPFLIPLLALKMIIVPLKILKFLKLIKLFLKLFIILPFFVRVVYPALTNSFNLNSLFQKIQDVFPDDNSHHPPHHHPHDAESRQENEGNKNASTTFARDDRLLVDDASIWDLRKCPSRVACEMGAFLTGASRASFPQNLANYLARRADRAMRGRMKGRSKREEDDDEEEDDEEEDQRDQAFKAFLVALGKKWSQEQCQVYSCAVLF